ncbi:MAG: hypothetical protein LBG06_08845, partial [Deltaproteobacteria bacterium]|nr:hypothetical protein [Deltaproteobacteria bacterium]
MTITPMPEIDVPAPDHEHLQCPPREREIVEMSKARARVILPILITGSPVWYGESRKLRIDHAPRFQWTGKPWPITGDPSSGQDAVEGIAEALASRGICIFSLSIPLL